MIAVQIQLLTDRSLVQVSGPDAEKFLQGLVTLDMGRFNLVDRLYGGLLSPQGKVLFEFFILDLADGFGTNFWIDIAKSTVADFIKRLSMYKLRADIRIEDVSAWHRVAYSCDPDYIKTIGAHAPGIYRLLRPDIWPNIELPDIKRFNISEPDDLDELLAANGNVPPVPDYDTRRIALGIPEGGKDYAFGTLFPHEAMFDQLGGVSFEKGCYVGQEIVSRMQHRGTARSRFLIVNGAGPLPPMGTEVFAGATPLGAMGSSSGTQGLALVRLDRLADACKAGQSITIGGLPVTFTKPPYATFDVPGS